MGLPLSAEHRVQHFVNSSMRRAIRRPGSRSCSTVRSPATSPDSACITGRLVSRGSIGYRNFSPPARPMGSSVHAAPLRAPTRSGRREHRPAKLLRDGPPSDQSPPPGSTTVALNPPSARFSSRMSPPWPRMMVRAMARPRPAPPVSRLRDSSSRTKGSNTRSRSASGMPGSSSSIPAQAAHLVADGAVERRRAPAAVTRTPCSSRYRASGSRMSRWSSTTRTCGGSSMRYSPGGSWPERQEKIVTRLVTPARGDRPRHNSTVPGKVLRHSVLILPFNNDTQGGKP